LPDPQISRLLLEALITENYGDNQPELRRMIGACLVYAEGMHADLNTVILDPRIRADDREQYRRVFISWIAH